MGMERVTDWILLWRQLVEAHARRYLKEKQGDDAWRNRARRYDEHVKRRWQTPDSSRSFVLSCLQATPGATVLDIGAGTGVWTVFLARHARRVTAVDPSPAMLEILEENLAAEKIDNVEIIQGKWPEVKVAPHDYSICAHAMYGYPDLPAFVRAMTAVTRRTCFMVLRVPVAGSLMAQAAERIWGQPYDSPNFQVAYNVLLQMGIYAHVLIEDTGLWKPWTNASLEEALDDIKRRFGLDEESEHDEFLRQLLSQQLVHSGDRYVWPRSVRSALVYWDVRRDTGAVEGKE
jgi:2-polyprenyl-3-methyl-5-hydroxy-6-metoxy-1,4-benzoquinol methylase